MQAILRKEESILEPSVESRTPLETWLTETIQNQLRRTATYQDKIFVAVVPLRESELIENIRQTLSRAPTLETTSTNAQTTSEDDAKVSHLDILPNRSQALLILRGLLDLATVNQMCLTLTYLKQLFLVVVPLGKVALLEEIEDWVDGANAEDALREEGFISAEQLDKNLGW